MALASSSRGTRPEPIEDPLGLSVGTPSVARSRWKTVLSNSSGTDALSGLPRVPGRSSSMFPSASIIPIRKTIEETWPSPVALQAHHEPDRARRARPPAQGGHDRRIEQRHGLEGVFHRETGAEQELPRPGQLPRLPGRGRGPARNARRRPRGAAGAWARSRSQPREQPLDLRLGILQHPVDEVAARLTFPVPKNLMMTRDGSGSSFSGRCSTAIDTASLRRQGRGRPAGRPRFSTFVPSYSRGRAAPNRDSTGL